MSIFTNILNNKYGKIILSVIWGFGLATIFRKICKGRDCIVIKGPKPKNTDDKVFRFNDRCYKYKSQATSCDKQK